MPADFDSYRMFYYVGKHHSVTKAASALFLSQSTVSRGIQSLEAELGCVLFERTKNGVFFTEEGKTLFEYISGACERIFSGEEILQRMRKVPRGSVRIGVSDFSFSEFVLPAISKFRRRYPEVRLDVISNGFHSSRAIYESLLSGKTDLACTAAATLESVPEDKVLTEPVGTYKDMLIACNGFTELREGIFSLENLQGYPFASLVIEPTGISFLERLFRLHGLSVMPTLTADSINMYVSLILQSGCIALVPSLFWERISKSLNVFEIKVKEQLPRHNVYLLTPRAAAPDSMRDSLMELIRKTVRHRL